MFVWTHTNGYLSGAQCVQFQVYKCTISGVQVYNFRCTMCTISGAVYRFGYSYKLVLHNCTDWVWVHKMNTNLTGENTLPQSRNIAIYAGCRQNFNLASVKVAHLS